MDSLNEQFGSLNNLIYENCYTIIVRYNRIFNFTNNSILDKIMDTLILGNSIFELKNEGDKGKQNDYETIVSPFERKQRMKLSNNF